ncbi:MAG: class I SAM-dependent methyltransferase [Parcubacteria group bacterium]
MDPHDLKSTYEKIADDYHADHAGDTWDDDFIEVFSQMAGKNAKVLDLGCGPGIETKKLVQKGLTVYGLDLSDKLLEIAKKNNPTAEFTEGDMRHLPYVDGQFDGVFAKASLLHIAKKDIPQVFSEISRVLKTNGVFHAAVKQGEGEKEETEDDYGYSYTRFFSSWSPEEFHRLLTGSGFTITKSDILKRSFTWIRVIALKPA